MSKPGGVDTVWYHGTTKKALKQIAAKGFLASKNGFFGAGVYLTSSRSKAIVWALYRAQGSPFFSKKTAADQESAVALTDEAVIVRVEVKCNKCDLFDFAKVKDCDYLYLIKHAPVSENYSVPRTSEYPFGGPPWDGKGLRDNDFCHLYTVTRGEGCWIDEDELGRLMSFDNSSFWQLKTENGTHTWVARGFDSIYVPDMRPRGIDPLDLWPGALTRMIGDELVVQNGAQVNYISHESVTWATLTTCLAGITPAAPPSGPAAPKPAAAGSAPLPEDDALVWTRLCSEFKSQFEDCLLAEFRALKVEEVEQMIADVPVAKKGRFRRLHGGSTVPSATPSWVPAGVRFVPNQLLKDRVQVGSGASSPVVRAGWDLGSGRTLLVALKQFFRTEQATFLRELTFLQIALHDHVVKLHGVSEDASVVSLVLEYLPSTLANTELASVAEIVRVFAGAFAGLAFLHQLKLLHRDVKPANILLDDNRRAKICDFGISKDVAVTPGATPSVGTLIYRSPELFKGALPHASQDVYALGLCLRQCLEKRQPWSGLTEFEIVARMSSGGLPSMQENEFKDPVSIRLVRLCNECTHIDPTKRPTSKDVAQRLDQLQKSHGPSLYDTLVSLRERMRAKDKQFYTSSWADYEKGNPSAPLLQAAVARLAIVYPAPKQGSECSSYENLQILADQHQNNFHSLLEQFIAKHNGVYHRGPRKEKNDCIAKALRDYNGDYAYLVDFERGTGAFPDLKSFHSAILDLSSLSMLRLKDRLFKPFDTGYRDLLLNVQCDAFVGELQLTVSKLWDYKETAHRALELDRLLQAQ